MFFHVILTTECNLQCKYCFDEALKDFDADFPDFDVDYSLPENMSYHTETLDRFSQRDPDCTVIFYGGEPLLCLDNVRQIMDRVKVEKFIIQTNGLLLDSLEQEYVNGLHTILVSLDGEETLTDLYRGKGVFRKVVENLKLIRQNGFRGEIIARMTVMEHTDIYKQVRWLLDNDEFSFTSVHWQLNAGFWRNDYERRDFKRWSEESYNPGIHNLVKHWVDNMEKNGVVSKLYPFLGIARSFLSGEEKNLLRCGAGWKNYTIQTDGHIIPCPSMWGLKDFYLGHITRADPLRLERVLVSKPCTECQIFNVCGGRCLYASLTKRWNVKEYNSVCETVRNLISVVHNEIPRVQKLIEKGKISPRNFEFTKYGGCEIIP